MTPSKRVVLVLVEGVTDKISLETVLPHFFSPDLVDFKITRGDITTRSGVSETNVIRIIERNLKQYLQESHLRRRDIRRIVHLADIDGAFIPDNCVQYADDTRLRYESQNIFTDCVDTIRARNANKANLLRILSHTQQIMGLNYALYFFSQNLEHVLHNRAEELSKRGKHKLAEIFAERWADRPQEFLSEISSPTVAVPGTYQESWQYLEEGCHSLSRCTNFHLCLQNFLQ